MRTSSHMLLLALAFLAVTSSPGMATTENNLLNCATTSAIMEGPCSTRSCAGYCHAKFQGSGTCFPRGCKCSFCRDDPPAKRN